MIAASDRIVKLSTATDIPPVYSTPQESLERGPFIFYLTGSRYFGDFNHASDYDYLAVHSQEVRSYLTQQGFELLDSPSYGIENDITVIAVYRRGNVDVQILTNDHHLNIKLMAMRLFKAAGIWPSKNKHGMYLRSQMWTTMLSVVQKFSEWDR